MKAEKRLHCITHYGFHRDGLRPETAIKLYKLMVRPILEYGSQVLTYQKHYLNSSCEQPNDLSCLTKIEEKLEHEHFQTKALKTLIGSPKSSSPAVVRLFSGVEPLKSRLNLLKLRYFWKLAHVKDQSVAHRVYNLRREQFLSIKNGFVHEVFNLCCKYNVIDFWHGKLNGLTNPSTYIKGKILTFSLKNDLKISRNRSCAFTDIYLSNIFSYQKSYHLVDPFLSHDFFVSASARCFVTKFLLQARTFHRKCIFCSLEFKDSHSHHLFLCTHLKKQRCLLRNKLVLYNFPSDNFGNKKIFYETVLSKKIWTQCFSEFF